MRRELLRDAICGLVLIAGLSFAVVEAGQADVIDFKGLQRPGRPAIKSYPIPGLQKESSEWLQSFSSDDSQERKRIAAAMQSSGSGASGSNSGSNVGWRFVDNVHQCASWEYCTQAARIECLGGRRNREYATVHTGRNGGKWLVLSSSETGSSAHEVSSKYCSAQ
jgi:hypothetical protein